MKRSESIFQCLSFGIKKRKLKDNDEIDNASNKLQLRVLPDDFDCLAVEKETNQSIDEKSHIEEPELLRGFKMKPKSSNEVCSLVSARNEKVARLRKMNRIFTWGEEIADPIINFTDINSIPVELLKNLSDFGINEPTPIQMQAIPIMSQRRDILASAPTGSGKTLAFLIPVIVAINQLKKSCKYRRDRLHAVILEPTRELAKQVHIQCLKYSQNLPISSALVVNILVSTPNSLISLINNCQKKFASNRLKWLIVDESDRLFDTTEGESKCFRDQLAKIYRACCGKFVRRAFYSATFSYEVEDWCKKNLRNVAMVCVGARNCAVSTVKQELIYAGSEHGKLVALRSLLRNGFEPPALIFVQSKTRAHQLVCEIKSLGSTIPCEEISSEKTENQRSDAIMRFREGRIWVLVCTELVGRGLDLPAVNLVINFDLPTSIISYIHRVGRTGRCGRHGHAITYFTEADMDIVRPIANVISQAGFEVSDYILQMRQPTRSEKKNLLKHAPRRKPISCT